MSDTIRLSPATTIEEHEGVKYLVTSDATVSARWCRSASLEVRDDFFTGNDWNRWRDTTDFSITEVEFARIPLSVAWRECYQYREGEPWCEDRFQDGIMTHPTHSASPIAYGREDGESPHADAAMLCGYSADSLRTLLREVEHE